MKTPGAGGFLNYTRPAWAISVEWKSKGWR